MKILGALMIVCAFCFCGFGICTVMKKRCNFWERFITALELLKAEIGFSGANLKDAFINAGNVSGERLFSDAADEIESLGIEQAWKNAVQKRMFLKKDEQTILLLSSKLGKTDVSGQLRHIEYIYKLAENLKQSADSNYKHKGSLLGRGCILIGVMAVLMLL